MTYKNLTTKILLTAAFAMLIFAAIMPIFGQKGDIPAGRATTREGTMDVGYMVRPDISDDLEGTDDEYFYKFDAGPGKLTVMLEITANETNAGAMLDLTGDKNNKAILSNMLVQAANGGTDRATKSVNLSQKEVIILRIKGMRYGTSAAYPGIYKILLGGTALNSSLVKTAAPPVEGQAEGQGTKPTDAPAGGTSSAKKPDKMDKVIEKGKSKTKKVLDILNKVKEKIPD